MLIQVRRLIPDNRFLVLLGLLIILYSTSGCGHSPAQYDQPVGQSVNSVATVEAAPESSFFDDLAPYIVTDKSAIIIYETAAPISKGETYYGTDSLNLDKMTRSLNPETVNYATLSGLTPNTIYYFQIKTWDETGNIFWSSIHSFRSAAPNLALNKAVSGTFNQLPDGDPYVDRAKAVQPRVTDGLTGYFEGMATSRSILDEDQAIVIDLGSVQSIGSVMSYWRALAYPESFIVRLSDDGANWRETASKINAGAGAASRSETGDPLFVVKTETPGGSARYIQLFIARESPFHVKHPEWNFVQLAEVQVFPDNFGGM